MAAIATLLESRAALLALRRTLPKNGPGVVACRTPAALRRVLERRLVDAVVLCPSLPALSDLADLRSELPGIPVVAYAPFRPDDGELLLACRRHAVAGVAVEGVDDPIVGDMVMRASITAERRRALADAPRMLRLTEPLQQAAWAVLVGEVERPFRTGTLAKLLKVSREHLSRQFGAGGAPNLKRVIDLTRIACAAQLLANPGFTIPTVVRVLHFASSSHLSSTARRIANVSTRGLGALGPQGCPAGVREGEHAEQGLRVPSRVRDDTLEGRLPPGLQSSGVSPCSVLSSSLSCCVLPLSVSRPRPGTSTRAPRPSAWVTSTFHPAATRGSRPASSAAWRCCIRSGTRKPAAPLARWPRPIPAAPWRTGGGR